MPKASRFLAAEELSKILHAIRDDPSNRQQWCRFFLFPRLCLAVPSKLRGGRKRISLASCVTKRIQKFSNTVNLLELAAVQRQSPSKKKKTNDEEKKAALIMEKIEALDIKGAVRIACSSDMLAPQTLENKVILEAKHPPRSSDFRLPQIVDTAPPMQVTRTSVLKNISSFPNDSAGGISCLRPQHLKDLTSSKLGAAADNLIHALSEMCNLCP